MPEKFEVQLATMNDMEEIKKLLKETARWLQEKEINQWGYLLNGGEDEEIKEAIINEETSCVRQNGRLIATFTLFHSPSEWDIDLWGNSDGDTIYLHRLAVDRSRTGEGLGKEIIEWVKNYLSRLDRRPVLLRLDCVGFNDKLKKFYLDCGFEYVGTTNEHAKFQMVIE